MKKKELINYLVFGVLTTLVNIGCYAFLTKAFQMDYKMATTIAWIVSVIFAFITNKLYVFNSKQKGAISIIKEFTSFTFFRGLSYVIDIVSMIVLIEWLGWNDLIAKIIANGIVIVMNYFASKYIVFQTSNSKQA
ncbi:MULTISPECIES: GtrA family protein [Bacillus]|uniref:GtrA family protein n=1 Tax=Bacillus bingmayongensis TaxID=1150157 RepID=A0ABU5K2X0_9BACI|nr:MULTISPECIES: GtrA family protein [Bacillus]MBO1580233.1 GtrA family protein [Bacillus sp. XF8]MBY0595791.1 GtrA family protein [Bacillus bingmayongensis]MDZ5610015.1 GtrA family protein [Bacillus pseudomycoides]